jgi:chromosome segregation ATPase
MINIYIQRRLAWGLASGMLFLSLSAGAQKYRDASDTTALNKAYGEISLDISKLNTKLIEAKNKTASYQQNTSSTASDAVNSGQASKDQAATATSGNTTDTKKAVRDAKRADREANNAKDAVADEKKNNKKIDQLTASIEKKQRQLDELDTQRAAIMAKLNPMAPAVIDSTAQGR